MNPRRPLLAALAGASMLVATPWAAQADNGLVSYSVAAQASAMQITEDYPTATFHPIGEGELTHAMSTLDSTRAHALSSLAWPGAAAGNVGSLIGVLGYPPIAALNDPVRAEAFTGGTQQQQTTAPSGTTMSASVNPESGLAQEATTLTTTAASPLGQAGRVGSSSATGKTTLDHAGKLVATAESVANNVNIAGVFKASSITSSATAQSTNGSTPTGSTGLTVHDLTIGGQQAYVDGSGVHVGAPGKPASPEAQGIVNQVLNGAGMQIYFTSARQVTIAGNNYDYGASVLLYWAPPGDTNNDTLTFSFGGAAVAMSVTAGALPGALPAPILPSDSSSLNAPAAVTLPPSPAPTTLSLPTSSPAAPVTPAPRPGRASTPAAVQLAAPAASTVPTGVGASWFVLLGLLGLAGIVLLPRLPTLLSASAAAGCARERLSSPTRPTRKGS